MRTVPLIVQGLKGYIPLPGCDFTCKYPTSMAGTINEDDIFIICFSSINSFTSNIPEKQESRLLPIGVCCRANKVYSADEDTTVISASAETRVQKSKIYRSPQNYKMELNPIYDDIPEQWVHTYQELTATIGEALRGELEISERARDNLIQTQDMMSIINIIADELLLQSDERLQWLQATQHMKRIKPLARKILTNQAENRKPPEPKPVSTTTNDPLAKVKILLRNNVFNPELAEVVERETARIKRISNSSDKERALDWLYYICDLPWEQYADSEVDLKALVKDLDSHHYGLDDVKEAVLEHMIVEQLADKPIGGVLCFVGPPGTGKTSIANSIAEVLNRPLIRVPVGGLKDISEIRGHRRTYVAATAGRFVDGLKRAGVMNPIFLVDEVDKINEIYSSGPSAAFLELFDPEQNHSFIDKYISAPIDFSQCTFICTANEKNDIPAALKDRLEIIDFHYYSREEKEVIVGDYIIPKILDKYNLTDQKIMWTDALLDQLLDYDSVRSIEKLVKRFLRQAAVALFIHDKDSVEIDTNWLDNSQIQHQAPMGF